MTFSTAIPNTKPSVFYIWTVMDELTEKFSATISKIPPDSEGDAQAFDAIISAMSELQAYSVQMNKLLWWWPPHLLEKAEIGKKAGLVFKDHFGETRLPPLAGVKSMTYIRDIILPFMQYIADIDSEGWLIHLCDKVGVNFKEQIEIANRVVAGMNKTLEDYVQSHHTKSADQETTDGASRQQEISASTKHIKRASVSISGHFAAEIVDANDHGQEESRKNRAAL